MTTHVAAADAKRLRLHIRGFVQGVGFRPFVYRLANAEGLGGFVCNTPSGVTLEIEGGPASVERFLARLDADLPSPAVIHARESFPLSPCGDTEFAVQHSFSDGEDGALVMPDLAICSECVTDIFDPSNRRFGYPFTTCQHCGPRFSIVEALPYDRERTAMRHFVLCAKCHAEYENPASRRFHAETIACAECGPRLALLDCAGNSVCGSGSALVQAAEALRRGAVLALKGLGGFQLIVDSMNEEAIARLRARKRRPHKPFALMAPSLAKAAHIAEISEMERDLLVSLSAPIVLLRGKRHAPLAHGIAPGNPNFGIMLPYTPLHHLLLSEFGGVVIATSGNLSDEPIVIDELEALSRLGCIADLFLVHDRQILRPLDDSVVRVIADEPVILRRARGYAPSALAYPALHAPSLALGGHQKNTVAIGCKDKIIVGPHIGDLSSVQARENCLRSANDLTALHRLQPATVACDMHPDYYTNFAASRFELPVVHVPHHLAHVLACMAENEIDGPVLGVAWDGAGYGKDGTVWGGEFLLVGKDNYRRFAHLMTFPLPGGEAAMREPRRAALGVLHVLYGSLPPVKIREGMAALFTNEELDTLRMMLHRDLNAPKTSSAGRLFDAMASLLDLMHRATFEGEAAMAVEFAADRAPDVASVPPTALIESDRAFIFDWRPLILGLIEKKFEGVPVEVCAAAFHQGLADAIVAVAKRAGLPNVLLTGGCFQNARLTALALRGLRAAGLTPYRHHQLPPNDGGLAAGQIAFAARPLCEAH